MEINQPAKDPLAWLNVCPGCKRPLTDSELMSMLGRMRSKRRKVHSGGRNYHRKPKCPDFDAEEAKRLMERK